MHEPAGILPHHAAALCRRGADNILHLYGLRVRFASRLAWPQSTQHPRTALACPVAVAWSHGSLTPAAAAPPARNKWKQDS